MAFGWVGGYHFARRIDAMSGIAGSVADAKSAARTARSEVLQLEDEMARQALIIKSLLVICEQKGLFSEPEFRRLVDEVDLSDGRLDGKYAPKQEIRVCPQCNKNNGKTRTKCMYCGTELESRPLI